uniref:Uncharacterized protein n=1 Tax=Caenorhabditis japonica TaxID=281687 RepID=A0A8R1DFX3_CAEJA
MTKTKLKVYLTPNQQFAIARGREKERTLRQLAEQFNFDRSTIGTFLKRWRAQNRQPSDESKFMLFGSDGISYVRRPVGTRFNPKYQTPTVKHDGGNVMVCSCFSSHVLGPLHRIRGNMDRFVYEQILQNVMLPFARASLWVRYSFQQDNDPKHTSNHIKNWFATDRVTVMEWPIKFSQLQTAWAQIPQSVLTNLPRRCQAVIDSRGFAD